MWPGVIILAIIVFIYIGSYALNKRTEAPDNLGKIGVEKCGMCSNYGCSIKQEMAEE